MTVHEATTGDNVFEDKIFEGLKTKFTINDDEEVLDEGALYKQQSELYNQQNKQTILLLEKALVHVRKYDSLETAQSIVGKSYRRCPSIFNKKKIADINRSLKAAIKADKWAKSRRRRRHVDESTVQRNLNTFYEKVADAVAAIKLDLDKRSLTLFSRVKKQYQSDLPLTLPKDKRAIKKTAHIIIMLDAGKPNDNFKWTRLEGYLFLIEDVTVLGVNRDLYKNTSERAEFLAAKMGATTYPSPLARPSSNIDWYVVQEFGVEIKYASFADKLDVVDNPETDNFSYQGYLRKQEEERRASEQLKTQRLAGIRQSFYEDNIAIFNDKRVLEIQLDNKISDRAEVSIEFTAITNFAEHSSGLEIGQVRRLYDSSVDYLKQMLSEGIDYREAQRKSVQMRLDARSMYFEFVDLSLEIKGIRERLSFLAGEIEFRKKQYANKLGLVSETKYYPFS